MKKFLLLVGLSACGYSDVVVVGSQAVILRNGFFGAVRSINACGVNDAGLTGCKLAEDKELTAGNPNAPAAVAPAAPAVAEPATPPPPPAEPAAAEPAAKGKDKGKGKHDAPAAKDKDKPAKGKKKKK